jgi:hypothetical protein
LPTDDDDPPEADWTPDETGDTEVMIDPRDLKELESEVVTPPQGVETLAGYELGRRDERLAWLADLPEIRALERHVGAANVLHAVRDHLLADGAPPDVADAIIRQLAERAGVKLG